VHRGIRSIDPKHISAQTHLNARMSYYAGTEHAGKFNGVNGYFRGVKDCDAALWTEYGLALAVGPGSWRDGQVQSEIGEFTPARHFNNELVHLLKITLHGCSAVLTVPMHDIHRGDRCGERLRWYSKVTLEKRREG
jgi:hypothetical protein